MGSYYPASEVTDLTYIKAVAASAPQASRQVAKVDLPVYKAPTSTQRRVEVGRRNYNIQFQTGKAAISPNSFKTLETLRRQLLVAGNTVVEIHGHTDNVGNPQANMNLSEARAFAVQEYLRKKSSVNFPASRLRVFAHGQQQPVVPNTTEGNRARNRRVEIVLVGNAGA
jgi:outer membrane protein OmpA-like peptidoglycan-associated protein